jgi:hypothetical protein
VDSIPELDSSKVQSNLELTEKQDHHNDETLWLTSTPIPEIKTILPITPSKPIEVIGVILILWA